MIHRKIITTDDHPNNLVTLKLECGHDCGPISVRRAPKNRRRCLYCEAIDIHKRERPADHQTLLRILSGVPMHDRAATMIEWVRHFNRVRQFYMFSGLDMRQVIEITEHPSSYPLSRLLFEDDELT